MQVRRESENMKNGEGTRSWSKVGSAEILQAMELQGQKNLEPPHSFGQIRAYRPAGFPANQSGSR